VGGSRDRMKEMGKQIQHFRRKTWIETSVQNGGWSIFLFK